MTYFQAYLLTRLDSLNTLFVLIGVLTLFGSAIILLGFIDTHSDEKEKKYQQFIKRVWKITLPICLVSFLFASLTPNTKEAAFIYIAPKVINNADLQESVKKLPELTNLGLEYLNDLLEKETNEK